MSSAYNKGALDLMLVKANARIDALTDQAKESLKALEKCSILGSSPTEGGLFVKVPAATEGGMRAVWRHTGTTGIKNTGTRQAGGQYAETDFVRLYETVVYDPNLQTAPKITVPEERLWKEDDYYKSFLNRASKIADQLRRETIKDPFEVFNLAFTQPSAYPNPRFFGKGNFGADGNHTALNERLVSTQHANVTGNPTQSNAITSSGNSMAFSEDAFWAARQLGYTWKDDVGQDDPRFTGSVTLVAPNTGNILKTAKQLNQSEWEIDTAENQINVHKGAIVSVKSHPVLLASAYAPTTIANPTQWFLADESVRDPEVGAGLVCIEFIPTTMKVEREEPTDSVVFKAKQTFNYGFVDWRAIAGSKGDEVAYSS